MTSEKQTPTNNEDNVQIDAPTIVQTDVGAENGQDKCPKCGSTDISPILNSGNLQCNFCRHQFNPMKIEGLDGDVEKLKGKVIGSGAQDIVSDASNIVTLECGSCGAEVVIDTSEAMQARCHWCRNTLSLNKQVPNGSVPDVVLPFFISKEDAMVEIKKFVESRNFYSHPKFKSEFTVQNINGVYFPYMIVDVNARCVLDGTGEHEIRSYTVKRGDSTETKYDAELYQIKRDFDIAIDDLTVESSADKLNKNADDKTTNIINAIMPFDMMNVVKWNANYLKGFSSEKRDVNIEQIRPLVSAQSKDIARFAANESLEYYDRGVCWSNEQFNVNGEQWKSAYLPVWLYSYLEIKGDKKVLHYVAVNARTKEVMGSVPIHTSKLLFVSFLIEIIGFMLMLYFDFDLDFLLLSLGFIYYYVIYSRYRNQNARHRHEIETNRKVTNMKKEDNYIRTLTGLSNSMMYGANNHSVSGAGGNALNLFNNVTNTDINDSNSNINTEKK